ncbi:hypothetical protein [Burkholderia sp. Ax-1719]|uniref:hypothetical protein n=1 Tax=Burkholderia sp. Ax-1719 TaxID=2608334 RepID=UPI00141EB81B|nr:hypothetical protein [Burkholderia sp. Ax-1719]NIE67471.1 hypothetical protein [Burkholderia sp. Ax-1719]
MSSTNPGPAITSNPVPQEPTGNIQKVAILQTISITPASVAATTSAKQTFSNSGLGLIAGDVCEVVNAPGSFQAGLVAEPAVCTVTDQLPIVFVNVTASAITPNAGNYTVRVTRPQPNESIPAGSGYMNSY